MFTRRRKNKVVAMAAAVWLFSARVCAVCGTVVSPNVPLHHWCYDALEKLAAEGLLGRGAVHARPLGRYAIGRMVEGLADEADRASPEDRALIRRLGRAFRREADDALAGGAGQGLVRRPFGWVAVTMIRSSRPMLKNVDPYEPFEFGRGNTLGLEGSIGANVTDRATVCASAYAFRSSEGLRIELRTAYVQFAICGTALQAGRDALRWGPAYHGDFLLTDNALPFPMVRVDRDAGPVSVSAVVARIRNGSDGDGKNVLGGWRIVWPYRDRLVVEAGLTSVFEEGRKTLWNLVPGRSNRSANQVGELGVTLYLARGVKVYAASAGDDIRGREMVKRGVPWGGKAGHLVGLYLSDPVGDRKTDFRFEMCRFTQDTRHGDWYTHRFGYVHRGYIIGHPVGRRTVREGLRRNERDVFARVSHRPWARTFVTLEYHRDSADASYPLSFGTLLNPNPTVEVKEYRSYLHFGVLQEIAKGWHIRLSGKFLPMLRTLPHPGIPGAVKEWHEAKDWMYALRIEYCTP